MSPLPDDQEEGFLSHLVELRDRLIKALIVVLILFAGCFYFAPQIMKFLAIPLNEALPPGARAVFIAGEGAFFTLTKIAFLSAVLLSLPWILYQAWAFVAPGLYSHERRLALPVIVSSVLFLALGIGFAYTFVLPAAYRFFFSFAERTGADVMQDLQRYWDFTLSIFFGFGLTFEVPVIQMLLVLMGVVTTAQLREVRRYVIVGAFVVAAVLTPPDILSQFMLAIPLVLLYELGIVLSGFLKQSVDREKEAVEAAERQAEADERAAAARDATSSTPVPGTSGSPSDGDVGDRTGH